MDKLIWLSILPALMTIALAIWSKKIIPSLLAGFVVGCYLLRPTLMGGFEAAAENVVKLLSDQSNLQVLLFLYLFSGLIFLMKRSGGIQAFSHRIDKWIKNERGVFYTLWALIPFTFIDCGFRIVGAGSILDSVATKHKVSRERMAFMLNNTASPIVELVPIATTFVGFNVANITQGLKMANITDQSAYSILLHAIPLEFFSIVVLLVTFLSIYFGRRVESGAKAEMDMNMKVDDPAIEPRIVNLLIPLIAVISLSVYFFWSLSKVETGPSDMNKAMLVALIISISFTSVLYFLQKYDLKRMTSDFIAGANNIIPILIILTVAWSLASVSQELGLSTLIKQQLGGSMPAWSIALSLFALASAVTYFIGAGWAASSLIMPFAIPLALSGGASIPLCVAAVITGGTFGDVSSPVAGMTNMASNVFHADHSKYLKYASPYNFIAAAISAVIFVIAGILL